MLGWGGETAFGLATRLACSGRSVCKASMLGWGGEIAFGLATRLACSGRSVCEVSMLGCGGAIAFGLLTSCFPLPPQITVIFKPYQGCTEQKVYQAVTDELPAAFMDGSLSSGEPGLRALWISERSPGRHVELHAGYIGVTVIVRQLGRYLTMAVRIPEEMAAAYDASQDLQLCLNGCPTAERIDRGGHLALPPPSGPARPRHQTARRGGGARALDDREARERCGEELEERDIYYHSCVFDLLTTGDTNFTAAAFSAQKDMESLHPHRDRWRIYPRGHAPPAAPQGRGRTVTPNW
uniref:Repulsive guidance molecule BMP co-receptor b n=1 Tax=Gadus morhua TaxID=8049 RepID=A0A8C5BS56_GADMO